MLDQKKVDELKHYTSFWKALQSVQDLHGLFLVLYEHRKVSMYDVDDLWNRVSDMPSTKLRARKIVPYILEANQQMQEEEVNYLRKQLENKTKKLEGIRQDLDSI